MYSIDTAIQKHGSSEWKVSLYAAGLWHTSFHYSIEDARKAVHILLEKYKGEIGA
jgi:hypothetical protein